MELRVIEGGLMKPEREFDAGVAGLEASAAPSAGERPSSPVLRVPEDSLRRFAAGYELVTVEFVPRSPMVLVRKRHPIVSDEPMRVGGFRYEEAVEVTATGRRGFGRMVEFRPEDFEYAGLQDGASAETFARSMSETLTRLSSQVCQCGHFVDACTCSRKPPHLGS